MDQEQSEKGVKIALLPHIKSKYKNIEPQMILAGENITILNLMVLKQKALKIDSNTSIQFFVQNLLVTPNKKLVTLHKKFKDQNGILTLHFMEEPFFG